MGVPRVSWTSSEVVVIFGKCRRRWVATEVCVMSLESYMTLEGNSAIFECILVINLSKKDVGFAVGQLHTGIALLACT